ncbi:RNA ligase family protein [Bacillus spongiae]|uniref:RNA ligase family protein n=1 Tax=Bacillus spongiae TaxID=2683610 RepID=A0ABU8HBU1_9BACI
MKVKYPRTFHLLWSEGATDDDKVLKDMSCFTGKEVVVTEKLDGENTSIYCDCTHARSKDSQDHPSRHWVKMLQSTIGYQIPENWRVCGENVYAKHSIYYEKLESYFYMFSIWSEDNVCLSWPDTEKWATELNLNIAPVLYKGIYDERLIKNLYSGSSSLGGEQEGYVVRLADSFPYSEFKNSVAKFVRENHVKTSEHWMKQELIINKLNEEELKKK